MERFRGWNELQDIEKYDPKAVDFFIEYCEDILNAYSNDRLILADVGERIGDMIPLLEKKGFNSLYPIEEIFQVARALDLNESSNFKFSSPFDGEKLLNDLKSKIEHLKYLREKTKSISNR